MPKAVFFAKSLQSLLKAEADAVHCQHRNTRSDLSHPIPLFISNFNTCRSLNITFSRIGQELLRSLNCLVPRPPSHYEIFLPHLLAAQKHALPFQNGARQILHCSRKGFPLAAQPGPLPLPVLLLNVWPKPVFSQSTAQLKHKAIAHADRSESIKSYLTEYHWDVFQVHTFLYSFFYIRRDFLHLCYTSVHVS